MAIDIRTLAIFLSLTNLMQVIALSVQYAMNRKQPGVLFWLLGTACVAAGFMFNYLRDAPAIGATAIFFNNVFFLAGMAFLYTGVLRYFDKQPNRRALVLLGAIFLGLIFFFTFAYDNLAVRRVLISTALAVLSLLTARALWKYKTRSVTVSANFLVIVFMGYGIFFILRALSPFFSGPIGDIFSATAAQVATYVVVLCVSTLWTFGFVLLVNQRLTQESLEAQEQLELIFNAKPDATVLTRLRDSMIIRVNDGFTAMTGYTRAESVGKSMQDMNLWKNLEERQKLITAVHEHGYYDNLEAVFQRKDGSELFTMASGIVLPLNGEPHILSLSRDITDKKHAEVALRESEARHRVLFQNSPDAYLIVADGIFIDCNRAAETMLRSERAYIIGKPPDALSPEFQPDGRTSREAAAEKIETAFASDSTSFEWMHRRSDGTDFLVDVSVAAIPYKGKPALFITWRDITERKRSEALIHARLELLQYANEHTLSEILQKALDIAGELTHSAVGFYHFVESDGKTLSLQAWSTRTLQEFCHAEGAGTHYPLDQAGVWAECAISKQPVIHNDYANLPDRKGLPEGHAQVVRELVVPILRGGEVVAILGVGNKANDYDESDVALINYFADVAWEITRRKRAEEELRASKEKFHQMADLLPQIIFETDDRGNLTYVNRQAFRLFGYDDAFSIVGMPSLAFHVPAERQRVIDSIRARMTGERFENHEYNMLRRDGTTFPALVYSTPILKDEKPVGLRGLIIDITERKQMEEELRESNAYLENLINYANAPIIVWDPQFRITRFNHAFETLTGRTEAQVLGQSLELLFPPELADDSMGLIRQTSTGERWETVEIKILHVDGTVRTLLWNSATLFAADGTTPIATIAQGQDITERKRLEKELQEQATTDVLTGAFNRRRFIDVAGRELKRMARLKTPTAVALVDLDHFKQVNDTYGHAAGDRALQFFTRVCRENIREVDVFARFGGDEFAMLFPNTDGEQAFQIVERIRAAVAAAPAQLDNQTVPLSISAGIAFVRGGSVSMDELLAHADRILYQSKMQGRNHVELETSECPVESNGRKSVPAKSPA